MDIFNFNLLVLLQILADIDTGTPKSGDDDILNFNGR